MRDGIGRQAGRLLLAIGLMVTLTGCVVYPAYGPLYHPYHVCCYWR